tara:strand:+ start:26848 stop:27372 length:525 start_codon:yes stop_codon:yes gene_type:complete
MFIEKIKHFLNAFIEFLGRSIAWLTLFMVLVTFIIVVLRYIFDIGSIALQESVVWMHAAVFMLGASYTLKHDEHVRVDIFYREMNAVKKAIVDLLGTLFFLIPFSVFILLSSWDYVLTSWSIKEASREVGGLPYPFYSILKSFIPMMAITLIFQAVANLIKGTIFLINNIEKEK